MIVAVYWTTRGLRGVDDLPKQYHAFVEDSLEKAMQHLEKIDVDEAQIYGIWELDLNTKLTVAATEVVEQKPIIRKQWAVVE